MENNTYFETSKDYPENKAVSIDGSFNNDSEHKLKHDHQDLFMSRDERAQE